MLSLSSEYILAFFKASGMWTIYGTISFLGFWILLFTMKESKGLTDREKKQLYLPTN